MNKVTYYQEDDMIAKVEILDEFLRPIEGRIGDYSMYVWKLKVLAIEKASKIFTDPEIGEIFEVECFEKDSVNCGWRFRDTL